MLVYNVTVTIDSVVHDEWLDWMKRDHIPEVMATGCFTGYRIFKVLAAGSPGDKTYSIQYACETLNDYERYRDLYSPALQSEHTAKYGGKFVAFRTLLETV